MTKGEAIEILNTIPTIGEQVDALDMAIEALGEKKNKNAEPIPQWRGCMDGCLPYFDGKEVEDEQIH